MISIQAKITIIAYIILLISFFVPLNNDVTLSKKIGLVIIMFIPLLLAIYSINCLVTGHNKNIGLGCNVLSWMNSLSILITCILILLLNISNKNISNEKIIETFNEDKLYNEGHIIYDNKIYHFTIDDKYNVINTKHLELNNEDKKNLKKIIQKLKSESESESDNNFHIIFYNKFYTFYIGQNQNIKDDNIIRVPNKNISYKDRTDELSINNDIVSFLSNSIGTELHVPKKEVPSYRKYKLVLSNNEEYINFPKLALYNKGKAIIGADANIPSGATVGGTPQYIRRGIVTGNINSVFNNNIKRSLALGFWVKDTKPVHLMIDFEEGKPKQVTSYRIWKSRYGVSPTDWELYGSNDKRSTLDTLDGWKQLDSQSQVSWDRDSLEFTIVQSYKL